MLTALALKVRLPPTATPQTNRRDAQSRSPSFAVLFSVTEPALCGVTKPRCTTTRPKTSTATTRPSRRSTRNRATRTSGTARDNSARTTPPLRKTVPRECLLSRLWAARAEADVGSRNLAAGRVGGGRPSARGGSHAHNASRMVGRGSLLPPIEMVIWPADSRPQRRSACMTR